MDGAQDQRRLERLSRTAWQARTAGKPGRSAPADLIDRLARDLQASQQELRVQFTRIAQLQAELDQLRAALERSDAERP